MNRAGGLVAFTITVALAACGGDDEGGGDDDGAAPDAAITTPDAEIDVDAASPDAADAALVTLTAGSGFGAPRVGNPVVFLGPDDAVLLDTELDTSGQASAAMPDGGSVVLIVEPNATLAGSPSLGTVWVWTDVEPGDELVFGRPSPGVDSATVTVPTYEGATQYRVATSCGIASSDTNVVEVGYCGAQSDFYVEVANLGGYLAYARVDDVTTGATVDLTAATYVGTRTVDVVATLPADVDAHSEYTVWRGDTMPYSLGPLAATTSTFAMPNLPGVLATNIHVTRTGYREQITHATRPVADTVAVDTTALLLGNLDTVTYAAGDAQATWTITGGTGIDHAVADVSLNRGGSELVWHLSRPGDNAAIRIPQLPAAYDSLNPLSTDTATAHVTIFATDTAATAEALAEHAFDPNVPYGWLPSTATFQSESTN
jgi:hypothetical protein